MCHIKFVVGEVAMKQILSLLHIQFSQLSPLEMRDSLDQTEQSSLFMPG